MDEKHKKIKYQKIVSKGFDWIFFSFSGRLVNNYYHLEGGASALFEMMNWCKYQESSSRSSNVACILFIHIPFVVALIAIKNGSLVGRRTSSSCEMSNVCLSYSILFKLNKDNLFYKIFSMNSLSFYAHSLLNIYTSL